MTIIDWLILFAFIISSLVLGLWIGRGSSDLAGFLLGGRSLPWYAVLGSIIATETSAVTFLSIPGTAFARNGDFSFLQLALGFVIGRFIVVAWLLPAYFQGEIYTAYEVLRKRFGSRTQRTASMLFMITRTVGDGLRLYLTALVLFQVTQFDITTCLVAMSATTIIYSSLGGLKSVVWNDCIQLVVYLLGAVVALQVIANALPGGWNEIIETGKNTDRFKIANFQFSITEPNLWIGLLGGTVLTLATHGTDQMMVQRYLCARTPRQAAWALGLSGPLVFAQFALFLLVGVALHAFYQQSPSVAVAPLPDKVNNDEVFALFIVQEMPWGLRGLTLAAVFSVAMSTLSSSLSGSASAVVNDFLLPRLREQANKPNSTMTESEINSKATRASQLWTAIFGMLQLGVGIVIAYTPYLSSASIVNQVIVVAGFASGIILGVFLLGLSRRNFQENSISIGMLGGFVITALVIFAPADAIWKVHGWCAAIVASSVTVTATWIADLILTPRPTSKLKAN